MQIATEVKYSLKFEYHSLPTFDGIVFEVVENRNNTYFLYAHSKSPITLMNFVEEYLCPIHTKGLKAYQEMCSEIVEREESQMIHYNHHRFHLRKMRDRLCVNSIERMMYTTSMISPGYHICI